MEDKQQKQGISTVRTPDFVSRYSNNLRFETYASDLKMLFGQSDMASGSEVVEQHTAMTIPWAQAKLAIYYLQAQIILYEGQTGKPVAVHPISIPLPLPDAPAADEVEKYPNAQETLDKLRQHREEFIASLNP